jgi:hypothetical protein
MRLPCVSFSFFSAGFTFLLVFSCSAESFVPLAVFVVHRSSFVVVHCPSSISVVTLRSQATHPLHPPPSIYHIRSSHAPCLMSVCLSVCLYALCNWYPIGKKKWCISTYIHSFTHLLSAICYLLYYDRDDDWALCMYICTVLYLWNSVLVCVVLCRVQVACRGMSSMTVIRPKG